ncbi:MAG: hypothetical protein AAF512_14750 [Pseudomonadota bacterium]
MYKSLKNIAFMVSFAMALMLTCLSAAATEPKVLGEHAQATSGCYSGQLQVMCTGPEIGRMRHMRQVPRLGQDGEGQQ